LYLSGNIEWKNNKGNSQKKSLQSASFKIRTHSGVGFLNAVGHTA
jgi:hypothetical protein